MFGFEKVGVNNSDRPGTSQRKIINFEKVKRTALVIFLLLAAFSLKAQEDFYAFSSPKVRIITQGNWSETGMAYPVSISLNLVDSTIILENAPQDVLSYLGSANEFKIDYMLGGNSSAQSFVTEDGWIFTFHYLLRSIAVSRRGLNARLNALWFDQVTKL